MQYLFMAKAFFAVTPVLVYNPLYCSVLDYICRTQLLCLSFKYYCCATFKDTIQQVNCKHDIDCMPILYNRGQDPSTINSVVQYARLHKISYIPLEIMLLDNNSHTLLLEFTQYIK